MSTSFSNAYTTGYDVLDDYPRPKVTFLPRADSGITIMGVMLPHSFDYYHGTGADYTLFQVIRNRHEVIITGPPLVSGAPEREGCSIQLELIERLLDTVPFDEINQAGLYITGDGRARLIPQIRTIIPKIPFISGVRCIEDSELKVTCWLYAGWKLALLDGIPVEVEYSYDDETSNAIWGRVEAMRQLLPLDLTTPLQAFLVSEGDICGIVTLIEDSQPMSYADRTLVYAAFAKLQRHRIYLPEGNYEPDDLVIAGDKVRFIRGFTGHGGRDIFAFDPNIHDQKTLADARKIHWQVADQLFEKLAPGTKLREVWASSDFTIRPTEAYNILNIVFAPEKPLDILTFITSITSSSGNKTSLSKKRRKGSSQVAATNCSVAESSSSFIETCLWSPSDESIDSSTVSDRPLTVSNRSSSTRRSAFLHHYLGVPTPPVLPYSTTLRGVCSVQSTSLIRSAVPLPPDDSDVAGIHSSHGWLEEVE
ncbi:hypothetical protein IW261DRAFT_1566482 [Armillaria novae-zelandiae]|uniref:Uncharacterized protein n=1 Tax=Armillaria novae-zelandiae TaxID=153914 RepID=A0AA39P3R9_9AGAR|nr:hypothetical protein IW261DRAFT_1566482 [Armillaria novae-zelandiae]